jgi:hypothetical protein
MQKGVNDFGVLPFCVHDDVSKRIASLKMIFLSFGAASFPSIAQPRVPQRAISPRTILLL